MILFELLSSEYSRNNVIDGLGNDVFDSVSVGLCHTLETHGESCLSGAAIKPVLNRTFFTVPSHDDESRSTKILQMILQRQQQSIQAQIWSGVIPY